MRRNNINAMLLVVFTSFALILPACSGGGSVSVINVNECSTVTYNAPSGTANNIVFTFDKSNVCGQYANGDWWVAPRTTGGTVTITSITPAQTTRVSTGHVMNGAEVNPTSTTLQGFDGDLNGTASYSAGQTATFPLVVNTTSVPITSVVKAVSVAAVNRPQIQFAAVLTVIDASANMTAQFRPSFVDIPANKFQLAVSSISTSSLGQVDLSSVSAVTNHTFSNVATATRGLQLDNLTGSSLNEYTHAIDNAYQGSGYGSQVAILYVKNAMRFAANDFSYSNPTHKQALINYLQYCIDLAGDVQLGAAYAYGGGYGYGRKLPLLFAGQVLGNSTITNLAATNETVFSEDASFYVSPTTGRVLHGEYTFYGTPWTWPDAYFRYAVTGVGSKTIRDPMGWVDSGGNNTSIGNEVGTYLMCCVAALTRYEAMAASMLGFGSTHPLDYMLLISNRIQNHGLQFLPDPFAPYDGIPTKQDITWGYNLATGVFFTGAGRWPSADGNTVAVSNTDSMGEAVWTYWIANHDIVPPTDITDVIATQPLANENVLNWTAPSGTDHYAIYRASDTALLVFTFLANSVTNSYTDSGLTTGTTYAYYVMAVDATGNISNPSNKATGTPN